MGELVKEDMEGKEAKEDMALIKALEDLGDQVAMDLVVWYLAKTQTITI